VNVRQRSFLVVIVEDNESIREALHSLLTACGFRVRAFASAEAFLTSRMRIRPHCLISDVQLPGITGFDLADRLARKGRAVPTVFMTGATDLDPALLQRAAERGPVTLLRKPFPTEQLLDSVQAFCVAQDRPRMCSN
jgi:FixJ family two-component response regulator